MRVKRPEKRAFQEAFDHVFPADLVFRNGQPAMGSCKRPTPKDSGNATHPSGQSVGLISEIACKKLVSSFPRERNSDMFAAKLRQVPHWERRGVPTRFVGIEREFADRVFEIQITRQIELVMICPVAICDHSKVSAFVESTTRERDRKSLQTFAGFRRGIMHNSA